MMDVRLWWLRLLPPREGNRGIEFPLITIPAEEACMTTSAHQPPQIARANGIDICYEIFGDGQCRADAADHGTWRPDDPLG